MKDMGLGVLDPHTVVIVLITLVLAQVLFGYPIPVDGSSALQLFISLVLLTGYLYAARSLFRLPLAAIQAAMLVHQMWSLRGDFKSGASGVRRVWRLLVSTFGLIRRLPLVLGYWLLSILDFSGQQANLVTSSLVLRYVLVALDRLGLVLITALVVLPAFQPYFQPVAVAGLGVMLFLFILKGNFSALLVDGLAKLPAAKPEGESGVSNPEGGAQEPKKPTWFTAMQKNAQETKAGLQPSRIDSTGNAENDSF